jgi:hypothetical protein
MKWPKGILKKEDAHKLLMSATGCLYEMTFGTIPRDTIIASIDRRKLFGYLAHVNMLGRLDAAIEVE